MTNWPDKELIRIIRRQSSGEAITVRIAMRTHRGNYATGHRLCLNDFNGDSIDECEEVVAVPIHKLKHLRDTFIGVELPWRQHAALQEVFTHLPADKNKFLNQAANLARGLEGPRIEPEDTTPRRIAILLEVIAFIHASPTKEDELTELARTCADWLYLMDPTRVGLDDMETSARTTNSIPDDDDEKRYMALTCLFARAATLLGDGGHGRQELLDLGAYALAWAARVLEERQR